MKTYRNYTTCPNCGHRQEFQLHHLSLLVKPVVCPRCNEDLVINGKLKRRMFFVLSLLATWLLAINVIIDGLIHLTQNPIIASAVWLRVVLTFLYIFGLIWQKTKFHRYRTKLKQQQSAAP